MFKTRKQRHKRNKRQEREHVCECVTKSELSDFPFDFENVELLSWTDNFVSLFDFCICLPTSCKMTVSCDRPIKTVEIFATFLRTLKPVIEPVVKLKPFQIIFDTQLKNSLIKYKFL